MKADDIYIDWSKVDAVIFDVDGTLFDLSKLRRIMCGRLLQHLLIPGGFRDVFIVWCFRRMREDLCKSEQPDIGRQQFTIVANNLDIPVEKVENVVDRWVFKEPLKYLSQCVPTGLHDFFIELERAKKKVGIFSDYPATDKISALSLNVSVVLDATMPNIGFLKPNPTGFLETAKALHVEPSRCLVIGDRYDRDGLAAKRGGFDFVPIVARAGAASGFEELLVGLKSV